MTRTETQLREALSFLAETAARPVAAPARASVPPRRGRAVWVLAVATVLVAAVLGAVLAVRTDTRSSSPLGPTPAATPPVTSASPSPVSLAAGSAPPQYAWFTLDPGSGWTVEDRVGTTTVQTASVAVLGRTKSYVDVALYAAGAFDPTTAKTGTPITVQGVAGWRGPVRDPRLARTLTADVWQYRPGAWAVVSDRTGVTDGSADATVLAVADAVRVSTTATDLALPFTVEQVPAGLTVDVVYAAPGLAPRAAAVGFADGRAGDPKRAQADGAALTILFGPLTVPDGARAVQVGAHRGWFIEPSATGSTTRDLLVDYGDGVGYAMFTVDALHVDRYGDDVLLALAAATRPVADVSDVASWVPAASGALQ